MTAYTAHRIRKFQVPSKLIEEIDRAPPLPPLCPRGKLRLHVTTNRPAAPSLAAAAGHKGGAAVVSRPGIHTLLGNAGGVAAPQQPRLAAPAPSLSNAVSAAAATSGALSRPPLAIQIVQQQQKHSDVAGNDGRLSTQQILNVATNQNDSCGAGAGLKPHLRSLIPAAASVADSTDASSPTPSQQQQHRSSHNGPEHSSRRSSKWNYDRTAFKNVTNELNCHLMKWIDEF